MHRLHLLGLNHTTAPLDVREKLAFNPAQCTAALEKFRQAFDGSEAVLLSTCNRVELYTASQPHGQASVEQIVQFLCSFHNVQAASVQPHLYQHTGRAMVEHLFGVASSLDSMVLGETQILGQVREAYEIARDCFSAGSMLNPLFQKAVAVGKQVMRETPLAEGRLSVASVAVDYAGRVFDHFDDKTVLCIGAGKMAQLVLRHFAALAPGKLIVANRDPEKAQALAARFSGESTGLENLDEHLSRVDIVITSTGSSRPIITADAFSSVHRRRRYRPIFMIDIALPRDVEAAVGQMENVYLYNLDDLQKVVSQTHAGRQQGIAQAKKIVSDAVSDYVRAHRVRAMGPVIDQLYRRYHQLAQEELNRTLNKLPDIGEAEKTHLEELARRIVNKLLHDPVRALRTADESHGPASQYAHAMEQLFKLGGGPDSDTNND